MPSKCAVLSCPIYASNKEHHMFRIPAVRIRATGELRQYMLQRRSRWGEVLRLTDIQMTHALVCGRHFVSGRPANPEEVDNVDWVPTLNLDVQEDQVRRRSMYEPVKQEKQVTYPGYEERGGAVETQPMVRIETTLSTCCIPGCVNRQQQWLTDFPRDKELHERWLAAILAGCGETITDQSQDADRKMQVCNMHFAAQAPEGIANGVDSGYREPTLFVRNDILLQVASCRLCMTFETVDNMFNMKLNITDGHSLQWLAKKYFAQFLSVAEFAEEGFFCERCTVQLDVTHVFWREISDKSRKYKWLLRKMANERVEFSSKVGDDAVSAQAAGPNQEVLFIKEEPLDDAEMRKSSEGEGQSSAIQSTITKETSCLAEPPSIHLIKPPPLKVQLNFKCYVCSSHHESKNTLIHHLMMDHLDHTALHCEECNVSFKNITLLNKHLSMHDPSKRIKCSYCPLRFRKTSARAKHEFSMHSDVVATGDQSAGTSASVKDKPKRYPCSECEKCFMYLSELQRHEKFKHQGEAIARCEICDKAFASNRNLSRHLKLHRDDAKDDNLTTRDRKAGVIACNLCNMVFPETPDMIAHLKESHPDSEFRTFACAQCDQVFLSQPSLVNHCNIHSDVFGCDLCGKRHYSKMMLMRHRLKKHGIEMDDDQYVTCPICSKRLLKGWDFMRHEQSHQKEKFPCETCEKVFRKKELLEKHVRVHTEQCPYECVACGMRFGSAPSLSRHKKNCQKIVHDSA